MKVLQIINSLAIGGAERLIVDTTPLSPTVMTDILILNKTDSTFEEELMNKSTSVYFLNRHIYNPLLIFDIIKYINKYDIIHAHLFPTLYWVGLAKLLSHSDTKIIFTEHSTTNRRRNHFLLKRMDRLIYNIYHKLICISPKVKQSLSNYLKRDDIVVVNNGIDLSRYRTMEKVSAKDKFHIDEGKVIIQIAGFRISKDQATTIRAMSLLPEEYHLVLVGDGELKPKHQTLVKELNLSHRIHFLGKRSDIPSLLYAADIVVVSSNWEGFGLAAVEGMAARKPVIASNVEGLDDVIGDAGILFEKGNEIELSSIIKRLCSDKSYYDMVTNRCYERAFEYDINKMKRELIKEYSNV